ncbi:MAG: efflux RND transporter periplasmic adaptor subunit [Planctomycetaceae bacterium]
MPTTTEKPVRGWKKAVLSLVLGAAALLAGAAVFVALASLKEPPRQRGTVEKTYNVEVFAADPTDLQQMVLGFGTAQADRAVPVSAQVAGEITFVNPQLEVGSFVQAPETRTDPDGQPKPVGGDLLVRIDPVSYQRRVDQAEAQIAVVQARIKRLQDEQANNQLRLEKAQRDYATAQEQHERVVELFRRGVVKQAGLDQSKLDLSRYEDTLIQYQNEARLFPERILEAEKELAKAEIDLQIARLELERTEVRPPFSGQLSEVSVELGQYVGMGDPLVRLVDLSRIEVPVAITLEDFAKIGPSLAAGRFPPATLTRGEWTGTGELVTERWTGPVERAAPTVDEATRTVKVYIVVENSERGDTPRLGPASSLLMPGTFVHVRIDGPLLADAIVVPRDAIVRGRVFVAEEGRAEPHEVAVGQTLGTLAVIESGLQPGDEVILTNLDVIHEGAKVNVQSRRALESEIEGRHARIVKR